MRLVLGLIGGLTALAAASLQQSAALAHAEKARVLTVAAQYAEASAEWREALRLAPSSAAFHNLYGLTLQQSGQIAAAQTEFRRALRLRTGFVDAQNNLAYSLWQSHQEQQAAIEADRALKLSPADAALHLLRGQLFAHASDRSSACHEFALATPWPKEPASVWEIMENCLAANNRQVALQAANLLPLDEETQLSVGLWLLAANLPAESVAFLKNDPREGGALSLAEAYLASCEPAQTLAVLSQFQPSPENDYQARDLRASALLALNREGEAELEFRGLVERFPDSPAAYVAATQLPLQQKRWQDALNLLNAGLTRMPGNWLLLFRRGIVYKLSGHLDEAKTDLLDSVKSQGDVALVAAALGDLEAEKGDLAGAADIFQHAWQQTKLPQFQLAYALALVRMGEEQKALAELCAAALASPQDAQVQYELGKTLARAGRFKEAQTEFETARRLNPSSAVILYALGRAYLAGGDHVKAQEIMAAFQKAKRQTVPGPCKSL